MRQSVGYGDKLTLRQADQALPEGRLGTSCQSSHRLCRDREPSKIGISPTVGEPLLALLGGYSVDVVHGILSRVINTIWEPVPWPGDDTLENQARARVAETVTQERLSTASDLVDLQRDLARTPEADELRKRLDAVIQRITLKAGLNAVDQAIGLRKRAEAVIAR